MKLRSRDSYVFGKASALARQIRVQPDKKQAAHVVCQRLIALLKLNQESSHAR